MKNIALSGKNLRYYRGHKYKMPTKNSIDLMEGRKTAAHEQNKHNSDAVCQLENTRIFHRPKHKSPETTKNLVIFNENKSNSPSTNENKNPFSILWNNSVESKQKIDFGEF